MAAASSPSLLLLMAAAAAASPAPAPPREQVVNEPRWGADEAQGGDDSLLVGSRVFRPADVQKALGEYGWAAWQQLGKGSLGKGSQSLTLRRT
jgi:hypothetical protein